MGTGGRKKKEVINNSKTAAMMYFDKLKKKQDQGDIFTFWSHVNSDRMTFYSTNFREAI